MPIFEIVVILAIVFLILIVYLFVSGRIISTDALHRTFRDNDDDQ